VDTEKRERARGRERDPRDRAASPLLHVGPTSPVDDDGGSPMPRPGVTCGVRPIGTGGVGPPGRRTNNVCPDKTSSVSPCVFYGLTLGAADDQGLP
jgi:hypothetical protein